MNLWIRNLVFLGCRAGESCKRGDRGRDEVYEIVLSDHKRKIPLNSPTSGNE